MSTAPYERTAVPLVGDERAALSAWLDSQRATILWKMDGLDDEQLRRVMVPSGLSLLGLVKHLTYAEHVWFVVRLEASGEAPLFQSPDDPDLDFHPQPDETTDAIVAGYKRICDRSRAILASVESLDTTFVDPKRGTMSVRWLMNHMIEETARHAGHADIMRELIDGATGY